MKVRYLCTDEGRIVEKSNASKRTESTENINLTPTARWVFGAHLRHGVDDVFNPLAAGIPIIEAGGRRVGGGDGAAVGLDGRNMFAQIGPARSLKNKSLISSLTSVVTS